MWVLGALHAISLVASPPQCLASGYVLPLWQSSLAAGCPGWFHPTRSTLLQAASAIRWGMICLVHLQPSKACHYFKAQHRNICRLPPLLLNPWVQDDFSTSGGLPIRFGVGGASQAGSQASTQIAPPNICVCVPRACHSSTFSLALTPANRSQASAHRFHLSHCFACMTPSWGAPNPASKQHQLPAPLALRRHITQTTNRKQCSKGTITSLSFSCNNVHSQGSLPCGPHAHIN